MDNLGRTVGELLQAYGEIRPGEVPTLYTIMKTIALPGLGHVDPSVERTRELCRTLPANQLYGLMEPDSSQWRPNIGRILPQTETYQKAYLRALKRLIAHGEKVGLLHPDEYAISPEWRRLIELLGPLTGPYASHRRSGLRSGFKGLARWATKLNMSPQQLPGAPQKGRYLVEFLRTFPPTRDSGYYRARLAWNLLVTNHHELRLTPWRHAREFLCRGIPKEHWPSSVRAGFESLLDYNHFQPWKEATQSGYESQLAIYLGALRDEGTDLEVVFGSISEESALRLLFQGLPPNTEPLGAQDLIRRLSTDGSFLPRLISDMHALKGTYEGKASEANPLLLLAINQLAAAGKVTSASNLMTKALALNRGILGMTERHTGWCLRLQAQLRQLSKRSPSLYSQKKRAFFRQPEIWSSLVAARKRVRTATRQLEAEWRASIGSRADTLKEQWAVALRNEVYLGMVLCYPLRARNFSKMTIGRHFGQETFRIYFPPEETKNHKEIDYELPDGGSLGDLRALVTQYLDEARPTLLAGRASPYFFVPNRKGGVQIPSRSFNTILYELCEGFLLDLLPKGARSINAHMMRHIAASYHLVIGGNLNLAAQILNDSPATIIKSYADILEYKKVATKQFLSSFGS